MLFRSAKTSKKPVQTNFYWRPKSDINFNIFSSGSQHKRMVNRFERFTELHQKDNIYRNMWFEFRVILW